MSDAITLRLSPRKRFKGGELTYYPGLNLFVGANGSGKSSMMEEVYEVVTKKRNNHRIVVFSSGQNESYSDIFDKFRRTVRRSRATLNSKSGYLDSLVFNREWAPLLIAMASFAHPTGGLTHDEPRGRVNQYLKSRGYRIENLVLTVRKTPKLQRSRADAKQSLNQLYRLISTLMGVDELIDAKPGWKSMSVNVLAEAGSSNGTLLSGSLYRSLAHLMDLFSVVDESGGVASERKQTRFDSIFNFFSAVEIAALDSENIDLRKASIDIVHNNDETFSNKGLSDGEFQLLMTYAILDLFESPRNVIILDESDSHIHQKILPSMWDAISSTNVPVLTTTHNPASIKYAIKGVVRALRDGQVQDGVLIYKDVAEILDNSVAADRVVALGLRNYPAVLVLDGVKDWAIFTALAKKKIGKKFNSKLDGLVVCEKSSSQNERYGNENQKIRFAKTIFDTFVTELSPSDRHTVKLKKVILLNDRDELQFASNRFKKNNSYQVIKEDSRADLLNGINSDGVTIKITHLFWHFREIENYLLTTDFLKTIKPSTIVGLLLGRKVTAKELLKLKKSEYEEALAKLDCKTFINSYICSDSGFSAEMLDKFVSRVNAKNISPYIIAVHDHLTRVI